MRGGGGLTLPWSVTHGRRNRRLKLVQATIIATWVVTLFLALVTDWDRSIWLPLSMTGAIIVVTVGGIFWALHGEKE